MTHCVTVSEIRQALATGPAGLKGGSGQPTTGLLGTIFHRVAAELLREDSDCNLQAILDDVDPDLDQWKDALLTHSYDQLFGPQLTQHTAGLQNQGQQVIHAWTAVQNFTNWLAELWWEVTDQGRKSVQQADWFWVERELKTDLQDSDWNEPVTIMGQADGLLRIPSTNRWCLLEWKTGRTSPELDTAQACLYHMILQNEPETAGDASVAVVSFKPELEETVYTAAQLEPTRIQLMNVIRKLTKPDPSPPPPVVGVTPEWLRSTMHRMLQVLSEFKAPCTEVREPAIGPTFVRFYIMPSRGITQRKVMTAAQELHLRMSLGSEPAMSVQDGAVAVDIPRPKRQEIRFSHLRDKLDSTDPLFGCAKVPIGLSLTGELETCDLSASESCHMLVVGTPGSGKSQWLRCALASLMMTNTSETLELLLIDPKRNAFTFAADSPMLREPIVAPDNARSATEVLTDLVEEMDARNRALAESGSKDLTAHIEATQTPMTRIVCICDEYADLLDGCDTTAERKDLEKQFKRIAQVGRAAGVHLILATQQPRTQIISSAIRSLIPAKVALRVVSALESNVALEQPGAEKLLGNGDLLYKCIGTRRYQGAWLPEEEESLVTENSALAGA